MLSREGLCLYTALTVLLVSNGIPALAQYGALYPALEAQKAAKIAEDQQKAAAATPTDSSSPSGSSSGGSSSSSGSGSGSSGAGTGSSAGTGTSGSAAAATGAAAAGSPGAAAAGAASTAGATGTAGGSGAAAGATGAAGTTGPADPTTAPGDKAAGTTGSDEEDEEDPKKAEEKKQKKEQDALEAKAKQSGYQPVQAAVFDINSGKPLDAVAKLKMQLSKNPKDVQAHYVLAIAFVMARKYSDAALQYQEVLKLVPATSKVGQLATEGLRKIAR